MNLDDYRAANLANWNERVVGHTGPGGYNLVDLIEDEDTISVVTKHTKRSSLKDFVAKGPALTTEQVADFVAQIADGIRQLHRKGFVHRDLTLDTITVSKKKNKPAFLMIDGLDLSICMRANEHCQQTFRLGRPLAPEIESGEPHDCSADIWSLGQIAFHLLSG